MERRAGNNCPTAHKAPPAPYYAVIFSSTLSDNAEGYGVMLLLVNGAGLVSQAAGHNLSL